ncbi:MAG: AAA family ATPase [Vallitalea sp.]|jgi:adenylate kinase family enzyme|nr:AAA family ATPase [Vallitalea sp.]
MSRGIIIFGSPGSGKTTLGKMVAEKLGIPYFDIDDYTWRKDTDKPFELMYLFHCLI